MALALALAGTASLSGSGTGAALLSDLATETATRLAVTANKERVTV
jgi:hypothetical protein